MFEKYVTVMAIFIIIRYLYKFLEPIKDDWRRGPKMLFRYMLNANLKGDLKYFFFSVVWILVYYFNDYSMYLINKG